MVDRLSPLPFAEGSNHPSSASLLSTTANGFLPIDLEQQTSVAPSETTSLLGDMSVRSVQPLPGMRLRAHVLDKDGLRPCTVPEALRGSLQPVLKKKKSGLGGVVAKAASISIGNKSSTITTSNTTTTATNGSNHSSGSGNKGSSTKPTASFWIDIDANERDKDELREWLQTSLKLSSFLTDRLSEPAELWNSQVLALGSKILVVFRILPITENSDDQAHMAALRWSHHLLLTFTSCPRVDTGGLYVFALQYLKARHQESVPTPSSLLCSWLLFHVERTSRATRRLRSVSLQMDEAMDQRMENVKLQEMIDAKDQCMKVLHVAEEQVEGLQALQTSLAGNVSAGTWGVLMATATATERMAVRVEKLLADLRQRHVGHEQERTNRRLAVLTVLSAVFLPLTLITGIWGMNFENMPELQSPHAYPIALCFMLLLALTMICFFRKAGWFDHF